MPGKVRNIKQFMQDLQMMWLKLTTQAYGEGGDDHLKGAVNAGLHGGDGA